MEQPLGSRYVLHELLGRGAMGQVFRGTVRGSGAAVAVKVLKPELVSDTEVVARFFRERSILTSIDHPNVAKVLDLVVEGDTLGIVMELVDGQDLRRYLRAQGTLPPAEAVGLVCQLLAGLAAVHAGGVIHRDVKPENVLVSRAGGQMVLKLSDFGISRLSYAASLTKITSLMGTPEYMAPELADHERATPAVDLYSAGIVLYEMLAGRTPFAGGHPLAVLRRQVEQPPPPVPGVPAALWEQVGSLLAKNPRSRPESAVAALSRLAPLASRLDGLPALPPMPDQLPPMPAQLPPMPARLPPVPAQFPPVPDQLSPVPARLPSVPAQLPPVPTQLPPPAGDTAPPPVLPGRGRAGAQRRRRTGIIALSAALVIAAAVAGVLLTRSVLGAPPASDTQAMATRGASRPAQPTTAEPATRSAASRTPTTPATSRSAGQSVSPADGSASSSPPPATATGGFFSRNFGTHSSPNFALDVLRQGETAGQPIILFHTASSDSAELWSVSVQSTTAHFYAAGVVDAEVALHYGCIPGGNFPDCYGQTAVTVNDPAFEIEYTPNGVDSGLCMGVASNAVQEEGVTLQPCGVARTVWIADIFGSASTLFNGYVPLINGSDTNFAQPFVLTYPASGYPTDVPRPQLEIDNISGISQGSPPAPELGTVDANQLWGADLG